MNQQGRQLTVNQDGTGSRMMWTGSAKEQADRKCYRAGCWAVWQVLSWPWKRKDMLPGLPSFQSQEMEGART